jgi:hypothetical protein
MQLSRARFLSLDLITVQGASGDYPEFCALAW